MPRWRVFQLRSALLASSLCLLLPIGAADAEDRTFRFELPEQSLSKSLRALARVSGEQIIFTEDLTAGKKAPALRGDYTADTALQQLLADSGLVIEPSPSGAIMIRSIPKREARLAPNIVSDARSDAGLISAEMPAARLEEIVVTAQRRTERLQDVPIAITVVTADQALNLGVTDMPSLPQAVAGFTFSKIGNAAVVFLRGVGTNNGTINNENSVAVYMDGVYMPASPATLFSFNNIERIEVLKGPQGTLFGRNATGGVIQIVTRDPQQEPKADISLGYAKYNTVSGSIYATAGITDTISANISVIGENQGEGWGRNLNTNEEQYKRKFIQAHSKWLVGLGDRGEARLMLAYSDNSGSGINREHPPGVVSIDGNPNYVGAYNTRQGPEADDQEIGSAALRIDYDFDVLRFVSITSGHNFEGYFRSDQDATPVVFVDGQIHQEFKNVTQEIQLMAPTNSRFEWVVGGFYYGATSAYVPLRVQGAAVAGLGGTFDRYGSEGTDSGSIYGQATVPIMDGTKLTGGLRFTTEKKKFRGRAQSPTATIIPETTNSISMNKLTWRVALDHEFAPDVMGYVSYNRGIKSGGFNITNPGARGLPYQPEQLDAYEAGLKMELFGNRARLNLAGFYYDHENLQVYQSVVAGLNVTNAAKSEVKGAEGELLVNPFENFMVSAQLSYLDGEYKRYDGAQFIPASGVPVEIRSAAGNELINMPEWSGNLGLQHTIPSGRGDFTFASNIYYNSGFYWTADNRPRQPEYALLNASVAWSRPSESGDFEVRLWANNITSTKYFTVLQHGAGTGDNRSFAAPRTFGVTLRARF